MNYINCALKPLRQGETQCGIRHSKWERGGSVFQVVDAVQLALTGAAHCR